MKPATVFKIAVIETTGMVSAALIWGVTSSLGFWRLVVGFMILSTAFAIAKVVYANARKEARP